jgi:hypothetical protein
MRGHGTLNVLLAMLATTVVANAAEPAPDELAAVERSVQDRIAKGEKPPATPADPGYPIMRCTGLEPVPTVFSAPADSGLPGMMMRMQVGSSQVICGNSIEGAQILAYREWYCGGQADDCVLSKWVDGHPTLARQPSEAELDVSAVDASGRNAGDVRFSLSRFYHPLPQ